MRASPPPLAPRRGVQRSLHGLAVVAAVALVHGCVAKAWWTHVETLQARADAELPARFDVSFVQEMALQPPAPRTPQHARSAPAPRSSRPSNEGSAARVVEGAASAPLPEAPAPAPEPAPRAADTADAVASAVSAASAPAAADAAASEPVPLAHDPAASAPPISTAASAGDAAAAAGLASARADAADAAASAIDASDPTTAGFDWPVSTRLRYVLTGNYRGEVHGSAQVEWLKVGSRYQVRLEVIVGLPFAPLLQRHIVSEGEVTAAGLAPRRYDETTKRAFQEARKATLHIHPDDVVLANGQQRPAPPGLQDSASQFVQLAWMFALQPERLAPGQVIELPLALPRRIDAWVYDVRPEETLHTPFGALQAVPLKPRRAPGEGGVMTAEIWFAPQLRYLPARIRIHQSADVWIDLMLANRPEIAAR